jgi:hypothetical protein
MGAENSKEDNEFSKVPEKKQEAKTGAGRFQKGPHPPSPSGKEVNMALKGLPKEGLVAQAPNGTIYIDLDDAWIMSAKELLANYGYVVNPLYYPTHPGNPVGAHITLVTSEEAEEYGLLGGDVEVGRRVQFSVRRCGVSFPRLWNHGAEALIKVWVKGKDLNRIRREVVGKVSPGKGFYIVVGVRSIRTARRLSRGKKNIK